MSKYITKGDRDHTSIGQLVRTTDYPQRLANKLIDRIEAETEDNLSEFMVWYNKQIVGKDKKIIRSTARYGYAISKDGQTFILDEEEQKVILEIKKLRRKRLSYERVAEGLNGKGIKTRKRTRWLGYMIRYIMKMEREG